MRTILIAALALPLTLGVLGSSALAESRTEESTSRQMAVSRSMEGVPSDASGRRTRCMSFGPTTHYRCTTSWDE